MFTPEAYEKLGAFFMGRLRERPEVPVLYDSRDLTTHALCVGMTGSGKTGLCIGLLEEALIDRVPAIVIDPKGDIGNLALTFPELSADQFRPWVDPAEAQRKGLTVDELAAKEASKWKGGIESWGQSVDRIRRLRESGDVTIYTPGSTAGRPVSILGSLAAPALEIRDDAEAFGESVSSTATSLLGLLGVDGDPLQSPEHVFLSTLLTHFWSRGENLDLASLIRSVQKPPFDTIGVMPVDDVFGKKDRVSLAMRMNNLLASPSFAAWLDGDALDIEKFLYEGDKPRISIFSIGHLDEAERMFFVSLMYARILEWTRRQSGTSSLRALIYMDEVYGYLPPVANPPSKRPILSLLKQARAFGVGLVLATQNPVDLDYKALSNIGTWFLGRLQTERDVARVVDGLLGADDALDRSEVERILAGLEGRQFLLHNVHEDAPEVFETRWVLSYLRGPLTRDDIRKLQPAAEPREDSAASLPPSREVSAVPAAVPADGERKGAHLPIRAPGADDDRLLWRPMVYAEGVANINDGRRGLDEDVKFGWIRGLQHGIDIEWAGATAVDLDPRTFLAASKAGTHLDVPADTESDATRDAWRDGLVEHVTSTFSAPALRCDKLKMSRESGESVEQFYARVEHAVREKRDAALQKKRESWDKKVDRLEDRIDRARDALQRQEDQASQAKLDAAVNVGEVLLGMFGGRSRRVSTSRATKVVRENRDVARAEEKVEELLAELRQLQQEAEHDLADFAADYSPDAYPVERTDIFPNPDDVAIEFCDLVWVPYWESPSGERRRAT